jgi:uncharacterized membrane protein YqaE (UPF0057 family)
MKKVKNLKFIAGIGLAMIIGACGTSSDAVNGGGLISKRKYTKGFHLNASPSQKTDLATKTKEKTSPVILENNEVANYVYNVENNEVASITHTNESFVANDNVVENTVSTNIAKKEVAKTQTATTAVENLVFDKKAIKKELKKQKSSGSEPSTLLYILLCLLVPFGTTISMYLYEGGWTSRVTLNLILSFLCVAGLIHALVIILGEK